MRRKRIATTNCRFDVATRNHDGSISIVKGSRISQKGSRHVKVAGKKKTRSYAILDMKSEVCEGKVTVWLPIRTISEANCFERWQVRHARHKQQKRVVSLGLSPVKGNVRLPCRIMLTRFAPDELDAFDNLPMSFKYIVDAVCAIITGNYVAGRADGDKRISIACAQEKSDAYGIKIEISWDV